MYERENWNQFKSGDIIYADRGFYKHYGIFISNEEVIHFNMDGSGDPHIISTSIFQFSKYRFIKKCYCIKRVYSRQYVIERARSQVGSDFSGYSLQNNNCEHFVSWCVSGEKNSIQVLVNNDSMPIDEKIGSILSEPIVKPIEEACNVIDRATEVMDDIFNWLFL